jgi:nitrite reductase/ring-hydroxylating ferredoxin subunit
LNEEEAMDPRNIGERLEANAALDRVAEPAHRAVTAALPSGPVTDVLHGVWLGHPLHPVLTDLPIGFWTSAFVLDLLGGRAARPAADLLVGAGVAAAVPTAAAGLADWSEMDRPERRTGVVHAASNVTATALYGLSFLARRRGHRARGVLLGIAGATAATAGAFLGGHLSFRRAVGVNRAAAAPAPREWTEIHVEGVLGREEPTLARLDGEPLVAAEGDGGPVALFDRCSHLGGPLHEGTLVDGCVRCPWHGSTFRMADGSVVHGPATATQPAYELRVDGERMLARRRPPA